jgi:hypothetical protein
MLRTILFLLVLLFATPTLAAEPFTKLWKGEELHPLAPADAGKYKGETDPKKWHEMPGVILHFNYSGKGELPKAKEFTIPLEKPLPLGTYRLFVKNFYVGKMEATLGDVTRPLTIRRYEWTPGVLFETNAPVDKITLRYFPSDLVADNNAKQQKHYIVQGIFLTTEANKVPIRGGEIIETLPQQIPQTRRGNYLANASFEVGLFPWGKPYGVSGVYDTENIDTKTAAVGSSSFRLQLKRPPGPQKQNPDLKILESRNYALAPGKYALSFYAKSEKPLTLNAAVMGATEDLKSVKHAGLRHTVTTTSEWKRYTVTADLAPMPGFLYHLDFSARSDPDNTIWLDAVQLENNTLTDFQPTTPIEVGYICKTPGHIFYPGPPGDLELLVSGGPAVVTHKLIDYWGNEIRTGNIAIKSRTIVPLPVDRSGIFRATFTTGDSTAEMIYSVLPANTHLNELFPAGTLGVDTYFDDKQLAILKRANFNWVISKFLARWYIVEREQGKYEFDDAQIAAADRAKMSVLLQPLNLDWGMQKWLKPFDRPEGGGVWDPEKKRVYMQGWSDFVYQIVNRYKGTVKHWEIENEPASEFSAEQYAELLTLAVDSARKADPQAKIVAFSGGGYNANFYRDVLTRVKIDTLDVFSVHLYGGNSSASFTEYAPLLKKHNKPGWNTETGTTCPTFFTVLPEYDALRQKDYWQELQKEIRQQSIQNTQNYLLTISVGGMEKYFYYFCRFVNAGPSQPTSRFGSGKELAEFDGSLRANAVALSIASHFFDTAKYHAPINIDEKIHAHAFQKNNSTVGFLYTRPEKSITLQIPATIKCYDIMGNPIEAKTLTLTDSPIYFTANSTPAEATNLWNAAKPAKQSP